MITRLASTTTKPTAQVALMQLALLESKHEFEIRKFVHSQIGNRSHLLNLNRGAVLGNVIQYMIGLDYYDSSPTTDCLDAELKLNRLAKNNDYAPKEPLAVTMINTDADFGQGVKFETSHFWEKANRLVLCQVSSTGEILESYLLDLAEYSSVLAPDWERTGTYFLDKGKLPGSGLGNILMCKTKGSGGLRPKTRAWYIRRTFLAGALLKERGQISDDSFNVLIRDNAAMKNLRVFRKELKSHLIARPSGLLTTTPTPGELLLPSPGLALAA